MIKVDILTGLLIGVVIGLHFTASLAPYFGILVVLTVVKMLGIVK